MSTQYVPPTPTGPSPNEPGRRTAPRVIALLTAVAGVAVVVGTVASAAVPTVAVAVSHSGETSLGVDGVSALEIDAAATGLTLVFDDVEEASLDVRESGGGEWTFEREGSLLYVSTPRVQFGSWFRGGNGQATLTLPEELAGLDADVTVAGGSFDTEGEFGDMGMNLAAGRISVSGTADTLMVDVSAGSAEVELADVAAAELLLGAGELITVLNGAAPDEVTASVSAGSLELTLPDEEYDVTSDVSAGDVDNRLRTDPGATRTVSVEVSAGNALLTHER